MHRILLPVSESPEVLGALDAGFSCVFHIQLFELGGFCLISQLLVLDSMVITIDSTS
jgi:hypothetical protein